MQIFFSGKQVRGFKCQSSPFHIFWLPAVTDQKKIKSPVKGKEEWMKGSQETFSLWSSRDKRSPTFIKSCSIFSIRQFISKWLIFFFFLTPAVGLYCSLHWDRTPVTKSSLYFIYLFQFGPEKSNFSKSVVTLGKQMFYNTSNTIKTFKSFTG